MTAITERKQQLFNQIRSLILPEDNYNSLALKLPQIKPLMLEFLDIDDNNDLYMISSDEGFWDVNFYLHFHNDTNDKYINHENYKGCYNNEQEYIITFNFETEKYDPNSKSPNSKFKNAMIYFNHIPNIINNQSSRQ